MRLCKKPNPGFLQLSAEDAEALSAFRDLRKGSLPPDLVLEWRYDVHAHSPSNVPRFMSTVLQDWQGSFGRVTITTTISDNRDRPMLPVRKQGKHNDEVRNTQSRALPSSVSETDCVGTQNSAHGDLYAALSVGRRRCSLARKSRLRIECTFKQ